MASGFDRAAPLAEQLRARRAAAGLSGRELARRVGVSQPTVSGLEAGRDAGHATVQRLIDELGLDARGLLGRAPLGPRPVTRRTWEGFARLYGFSSRRVVLRVEIDERGTQRSELEVTGLRLLEGARWTVNEALRLMSVAMVGSAEATFGLRSMRSLPEDGLVRVEDGELVHEFEVPPPGSRTGLRYRRIERGERAPAGSPLPGQAPHGRPFDQGACLWLDHPCRSLEIRVRFPVGEGPGTACLEAWPASVGVDAQDPVNLWPGLRPQAARAIRVGLDGLAELRVERPLPGPCYGLSWDEAAVPSAAAASPLRVSADAACEPAAAVRRAREREGWSRRELARRAGLSAATLHGLESGSEPRLSSLRVLCETLPELSPHELFRAYEPRGDFDADEAWRLQRELFGMEALEELSVVRIAPAGDVSVEMTTKGLSWTSAALRDLRLRHGLARVPDGSTWELDAIEPASSEANARVRVLRRGIGPVVHELRFGAEGSAKRVSFTRRVTGRGQLALTHENARRLGRSVRDWEALFSEPSLPARRLRFELRFPRGCFPASLSARVVPRCQVFGGSAADRRALCHPEGFAFELDPRARRAVLTVEKPLVGMRYLVGWMLAGAPDEA